MKISCCFLYAISKYGYPPKLQDMFEALNGMKEMGFKYIELEGYREKNLKEVYSNKEKLKQTCEELGMKVINFCPVLPGIVSLNNKDRQKNIELFKIALELAVFFDCSTIQIDSYTPPFQFIEGDLYKHEIAFGKGLKVVVPKSFHWEKQWDTLVDSVSRLNQFSKSTGLPLCLEPRVGELISNTDSMLRLMDAVNDENFGAVFDTGHLNAQKEILPLSIEKLGKRIFYLHVSDNDSNQNEHLQIGKGTIDWETIFQLLKKHKFKGYAAIDVGNVPNLEEAYIESRKYLENISAQLDF